MPPTVPAAVASSSIRASLAIGDAIELREHLKRESEQGVAGEDRDRFAEHFVASGPAAPQVVVIERGQIIVDQRIGMDQLQRGGGGFNSGGRIGDRLRGRYTEDGPDALSAREEAIAHRFMNGFGRRGFRGNQTPQSFLNADLLLDNVFGERHALSG